MLFTQGATIMNNLYVLLTFLIMNLNFLINKCIVNSTYNVFKVENYFLINSSLFRFFRRPNTNQALIFKTDRMQGLSFKVKKFFFLIRI